MSPKLAATRKRKFLEKMKDPEYYLNSSMDIQRANIVGKKLHDFRRNKK